MLPEIKDEQSVFIEITNLLHGGQGWELGTCLWSPIYVTDSRGRVSRPWKIMEQVNSGDLIIHIAKHGTLHHWLGISLVNSNRIETVISPPIHNPTRPAPFQRINLKSFIPIATPVSIQDFFSYEPEELRQILRVHSGQFFESREGRLVVGQKYLARCASALYDYFNRYSDGIGFNPTLRPNDTITTNIPTENEPQHPDYLSPGRVPTSVSRIVRDTILSRTVKAEFHWKCQICGNAISLPSGGFYAEGHHLKPLGGADPGPDVRENIMVLCPTHHAEFDYGSIAINPDTNTIEHIQARNQFHGLQPAYHRADLAMNFLRYHYDIRFNKR